MIDNFLKRSAAVFAASLLVLSSACSRTPAASEPVSSSGDPSSAVSAESSASSAAESSQVSSSPDISSAAAAGSQTVEEETVMANLTNAAKKGRVLHCDFAAKANCIEDVQKIWGNGENSGYVAAAKGTYVTYPKQGFVFGFNKGDQIFEVRTFDGQLQKVLTLSKIEKYFGKPNYNAKTAKEEIVGYAVNPDFKLLFVFEQPKAAGDDPALDHYSVLYPAGTVNSMADDPGREW